MKQKRHLLEIMKANVNTTGSPGHTMRYQQSRIVNVGHDDWAGEQTTRNLPGAHPFKRFHLRIPCERMANYVLNRVEYSHNRMFVSVRVVSEELVDIPNYAFQQLVRQMQNIWKTFCYDLD
jgi:hypothetical protein